MKPISAAPTGVDTRDMLVVHGALRRAALLPGLVSGVRPGDVAAELSTWRPYSDAGPGHVPPPLRVVLPRLAPRLRDRHFRRVHGTSTP